MANLTSDKNLDKHLKVIKSGEEITSLELATEGNGAKVKGDLEITGSITNTVGVFELLGDKIVVNAGFLYFIDLQNRLHFSANDVDNFYNMFFVSNSDTTLNVNNAKTKGIQTEIRGGTITAADTTNTYDSALNVSVTLNDTSDSGACIYKLIEGVATNTDITGWDELYLLHLTGASTFYVDNAGNVALSSGKRLYLDGGGDTYISENIANVLTMKAGGNTVFSATGGTDTAVVAQRAIFLSPNQAGGGGKVNISEDTTLASEKKLYFDGGTDTYIHESGADILDFQVGDVNMLRLQENGASSTAAIAGRFRLTNHDGSTYDDTSASAVQTKAQIDAAISAGGGGGTSRWSHSWGGYKTSNSSSTTYYFQYYPNNNVWNNSESSPTSVTYFDGYAAEWIAPADGTITQIDVFVRGYHSSAPDDVQFYVFKGTPSDSGSTSISLTQIAASGAVGIGAGDGGKVFRQRATISSSNTFSSGDGLWIMLKKESHSNSTSYYFSGTISGEYS